MFELHVDSGRFINSLFPLHLISCMEKETIHKKTYLIQTSFKSPKELILAEILLLEFEYQ